MRVRAKTVWAHEGGNPRAAAFKQLEMSVKRAYQLNSGLIDSLALCGDVATLKNDRVGVILSNKDLKAALNQGRYGTEDPACHHQHAWEFMVTHWYSGALRRSVIATMDNMTEENRKTIKKKVNELYE